MTEKHRQTAVPASDAGHIPMTEELDRARWTLPPFTILALALVGLGIVVAIILWATQAPPVSRGSIDHVAVVEQQGGEHVLVALQITVTNLGERAFRVNNVKAELRTPQGEWSDDASSAVDHDRYFAAYPELRQHVIPPLLPETQLAQGERLQGMVIFGFPMSRAAFEGRESLTVTVEPYLGPPLVLRESRSVEQ